MSDVLRIMLCVNNPDNGVHSGYLRAVDFADLLSVWAYDNAMTCRLETDGKLRIGSRKYPIIRYSTWVGNWCWDSVLVDGDVANAIAEHVRKSGKFRPEMGVIEVWEAWDAGQPIRLQQVIVTAAQAAEEEES